MIFDCITFFRENFIANLRFEILKNCIDYFVVCESLYDHRGKKKKLNFRLKNLKIKNKLIYIILDKPFQSSNPWERQAIQREFIFTGLKNANEDDYIMFSDPDEIPNPEVLKDLNLTKKYGIFLQKHFVYKLNIYNPYSTPWEGTRVCKLKNLKSIDFMRQKVLKKNIRKWWRPDKEKSIQLIENGGWHFNNLFSAKELSLKLRTFAHTEFSSKKFSDISTIKKKIKLKTDLFGRNEFYNKVDLDKSFPDYILKNKLHLKKYIDI